MPFIDLNKTVRLAEKMNRKMNNEEFEEFCITINCMLKSRMREGYKLRTPYFKEFLPKG